MRVETYTVWIETKGAFDLTAVDAFKAIPGYIEHEWVETQETD